MKTINVLLTTVGRSTLPRMLESLVNQLLPGDYLTVVSDKQHQYVRECLNSFNFQCSVIHICNSEVLGYWGHGSRNKWQNTLKGHGDYIMNADDDDSYVEGAFEVIRSFIGEDFVYLFQHQNAAGHLAWSREGVVCEGNVGTSCGVIPNTGDLPEWAPKYGGDGTFYEQLAQQKKVVFIGRIIYRVYKG